jgi:kynurenine formamidase
MRVASDVVDLSVPFYEGMPCDDLGPKIWERIGYAYSRQLFQETQSRAGRVFLTTDHTGTHVDGPLRFDPNGTPIEQVPLERFVRPARVFDLRTVGHAGLIGPEAIATGLDAVSEGDAVVLWTGHDRYLKNPDYFWNRPQLTAAAAQLLAARRPGIVAADFPGIGRPSDDRFEVKRILHAAGVMTVEQLCNLGAVAGRSWHLFAGPLRVRGTAGSIIRACALVDWKATKLVDMTHDIFPGMPALGAVPSYWTRANHRLTHQFYQGALSYQTNSMMLTEHAGTHFDAPYHFDEHGPAIHELALPGMIYPTVIFDMTHKAPLEGIGPDDLQPLLQRSGKTLGPGIGAVIWTGHSKNYVEGADFGGHRPFITAEGASWLAAQRCAVVITDLVGLDEPIDLTEPVHNILLHAGICMLQVTTNLAQIADGNWEVCAFPLKIVQGTGAPLRAFAARV